MDANGIADVLAAALPGVAVEVAPTVDLQSTLYIESEPLLSVL